jgi:hypothetical protein
VGDGDDKRRTWTIALFAVGATGIVVAILVVVLRSEPAPAPVIATPPAERPVIERDYVQPRAKTPLPDLAVAETPPPAEKHHAPMAHYTPKPPAVPTHETHETPPRTTPRTAEYPELQDWKRAQPDVWARMVALTKTDPANANPEAFMKAVLAKARLVVDRFATSEDIQTGRSSLGLPPRELTCDALNGIQNTRDSVWPGMTALARTHKEELDRLELELLARRISGDRKLQTIHTEYCYP